MRLTSINAFLDLDLALNLDSIIRSYLPFVKPKFRLFSKIIGGKSWIA